MLTTVLAIITFFLFIAVSVFLGVVSTKQFEMSQKNKKGIYSLRKEDREMHGRLEQTNTTIGRIEQARRDHRAADADKFRTASLNVGDVNDEKRGAQLGTRRPYGDSNKNRGMQVDPGLHITDKAIDRYAPIAAGKIWSADGVMLDGKSCLETGVGIDGDNGTENGRICYGKLSDGLDIIGKETKVGAFGDNKTEDWEDALRKVYIHDYLHTKAIDTDFLRVKGGTSAEHNPDKKETMFASKIDGKNYLRGDTVIDGKVKSAGSLTAKGHLDVKGGTSDLNPNRNRTIFANAKENGKNTLSGDTRVKGHVSSEGDIRAGGEASFKGGQTDVELDDDGNMKRTVFNNKKTGENVIRGDTQVSGHVRHHGDVKATRNVTVDNNLKTKSLNARRMRLANNTDKNNMVFEAGRTSDGNNEGLSTINFNGKTDDGDVNLDAGKMRWRVGVDQRANEDRMFIDRFGGGNSWTPISIKDGKIQLRGEVSICDNDGENCQSVQVTQTPTPTTAP
jgi:hypothetical protein